MENKNLLITYLEDDCAKSGDFRTESNILRRLRLMTDGEVLAVVKKLYKNEVDNG